MSTKLIVLMVVILVLAGFLRIWTDTNIFGSAKINTYEHFGKCWQGDVRVCDYDPFE